MVEACSGANWLRRQNPAYRLILSVLIVKISE